MSRLLRSVVLLAACLFAATSFAQSAAYDLWKTPSFFRGYNVLNENPKSVKDFQDLEDAGASLAYIATFGWYGPYEPFPRNESEREEVYSMINKAREVGLRYAIAVREGPGRTDVYKESIGDKRSTLWTNAEHQRRYASMLREIVDELKDDPLFVGIAPIVEPNPLSDKWYVNATGLAKMLKDANIDLASIYRTLTDSIRAASRTIPIIVQGAAYSSPEFFPTAPDVDDQYIVYEFHSYRPREYVYADSTASVFYPDIYPSYIEIHPAKLHDKRYLNDSVYKFIRKRAQETGRPIFLGEFGLQWEQAGGHQLIDDQSAIAIDNGWHFAYWDWRRYDGRWDYELFGPQYWNVVLNSFSRGKSDVERVPEDKSRSMVLTLAQLKARLYKNTDAQIVNLLGQSVTLDHVRPGHYFILDKQRSKVLVLE
ncbi:MAG TPA: cellulase family glycosylhydrolase [Candidatus Kapabacteria bacterium]|nr:cellulase family glycosylhydrolase [Candidatus Kapabacteria bacterium]